MAFEPYVVIEMDKSSQAVLLNRITKALRTELSEFSEENAEYAKREIVNCVQGELVKAFELGMKYAQGRIK